MQMNPSLTIERKRVDCSALPKGWQREEVLRKSGISAGKVDVFYYSRTMRNDVSLVPPIRQTASIFKQPVTVVRNHRNNSSGNNSNNNAIKLDANNCGKQTIGNTSTTISSNSAQEKPQQIFWEKRLERMRACHSGGEEFEDIVLPKSIRTIGPLINEQTVLQSLATALHVLNVPVTGQTATKTEINKNAPAYINPEQPLMQAVLVNEEDIRKQEDRVNAARKKLQDALRA